MVRYMKEALQSLILILVAGVVCLNLTSCETGFFAGPASIQAGPDSLRVSVCDDMKVTHIVAKERQKGIFGRWVTFWDVTGELDVSSGSTFDVGAHREGLVESISDTPDLRPGDELSITFFNMDGSVAVDAVSTIGAGGLPTDSWLQADGDTTKAPCMLPSPPG